PPVRGPGCPRSSARADAAAAPVRPGDRRACAKPYRIHGRGCHVSPAGSSAPTSTNGADVAVERTAGNPVTWSAEMGFNQGELVSGHTRTLYCSGQTAMSADGTPLHEGDMAAQLALSLDNLEAVLGEAGMSLAHLVRLNVHTTDVELLLPHYGVL